MPTLSDRLMPHLRRATLSRGAAPLTDGQLLGAFVADRDAAAFEALVRRRGRASPRLWPAPTRPRRTPTS